jgi:LAGLIDADG endonuclease
MVDATRAYIAGFLDGDGSIIFQLVRRRDYVYGFQIRASVCFYQSTRGKAGLEWLKQQLGCGYIRDRAGSMSDYTIVGWLAVKRVLELVQPFTIFKREQVDRALALMARLDKALSPEEFLEAALLVDAFATLNYSKKKLIGASSVDEFLHSKGLLVPVTTEAEYRDHERLPLNTEVANLAPRSHASSRKRDEDIVCAPSNRGNVHA